MTTRPIRFFHQGRLHAVSEVAPTLSLLDWLREHQRCTGSKEGCNEGDCGACTVLVAELADAAATTPPVGSAGAASAVIGGLRLRPVNACLQFLPTLDGKAVLTVEDVAGIAAPTGPHATLHPAQQALVQCHASQCGFCTPGFVMTLTAIYEHHQAAGTRPTRPELADALAGNLCRCTGYRPILDAGEQMFDRPAVRLDTVPIVTALRELQSDPPLHYTGPNAADGRPQRFHAPRRLADLAWLLEMHPDARLLAGATDIGLWVNKQFRDLGELIYVGDVAELKAITHRRGSNGSSTLQIGAAAALEDAWAALAAIWPELREVWRRFASPPIRHAGTLGGNLANGSPIGDGAPPLIALDAQLVLQRGTKTRTLALDEFYLDYMKNQLQPGEFIVRIDVPLPSVPPGGRDALRVWKLSKRFDSDISAICAAFALQLQGGLVRSVRLVYGGMAATVRRAAQAEAELLGQPWTEASVRAAMAALDRDFQPLSDLRASAAYRRKTAAHLLWRLWLETRPDAPLTPEQTSVWAAA
ncbi:MAG: xanthine dehydrogenase small subunit [Leptothrix sp. (in: b-proteobacteria)]